MRRGALFRYFTSTSFDRETVPVADNADQPLFVGAENGCMALGEGGKRGGVRVAVGVVEAGGDDAEGRMNGVEESGGAGGPAAVMAYLENIVVADKAFIEELLFDLLLHVAGQQE